MFRNLEIKGRLSISYLLFVSWGLDTRDTRSKTTGTNCLMVAPAIVFTVESRVKCKRKHMTKQRASVSF